MSYSSVFRFLAFIMLFISLVMLIPMGLALHYGEDDAFLGYVLTIVLMVISAVFILNLAVSEGGMRIGPKESMLIVSLTWVVMAAFGALPMYAAGDGLSYSKCFFEIMSGFTTAGATVLVDIEALDRSIIFWRSLTSWLGGMGVVVLFIAVLPIFGLSGNTLFGAESVGATKSKFMPTIRGTAVALWSFYVGLSAAQTLMLMTAGLDPFNAVTVMFGTMGAAGFAPLNASIGGYGNDAVEWICVLFMFLAGCNFTLFFYAIKRNFRKIARNGEFRMYFMIILFSIMAVMVQLFLSGTYRTLSESLRAAAFHVVSMMTTTGYVTDDFNMWPMFSQMILIVVCFIGACSGSAGGGMKVVRIGILLRLARNSMLKRIHPSSVSSIQLGNTYYDTYTALSIAGYAGCYFLSLFAGSVVISLTGFDFLTCFSSVFLCLGNLGTGIGGLGSSFNFSIFPEWSLWVFSFLMLVGRLEFYTVYSLFTRMFWKR